MTEVCRVNATGGASCDAQSVVAARDVADWLCLAATPTFAIMALLTGVDSAPDILCSATQVASPLCGMALMYLLMSAFHLAPWLKLISSRQNGACRS